MNELYTRASAFMIWLNALLIVVASPVGFRGQVDIDR